MIFRPLGQARHHLARAVFLLAALALAPSAAEASCGHDAIPRVGRPPSVSDLTILEGLDSTRFHPLPSAPRGDRPCSGPSCSRGQGLPHAPAPSISPRHDDWCLTAPLPPPARDPRIGGQIADAPLHPRHFTIIPDRPPRARQADHSS
ncbi:MAG: hypothetical protein ACYC61_29400 [Isosphaeraceae bacterium]